MKRMSVVMMAMMMLALLVVGTAPVAAQTPATKKVTVAWSVWPGWMPFRIMDKQGFMDKRAKEYGVQVELKEFKGYMDSVQAFAAEQVDGCAMTSMESLQPASSGVRTVAVLANDISNGGDGVLVRKGQTIKDLAGKQVYLEQFSVSHYLLTRALAKNGLSEADVRIVNIPGDEAGKAFLTDDTVEATATWNPHLFNAQESGKGVVAFDSTMIKGEIIDLLVLNGKLVDSNPKAVEAIVAAWYDAMEMITNPATRDQAIAIMAEGAGATPKEFEKMMGGMVLFTDATKAVDFVTAPELPKTMELIKKFSVEHELISDGAFKVGYGPGSKELLSFNPTFMQKYAAGMKRPATMATPTPAATASH